MKVPLDIEPNNNDLELAWYKIRKNLNFFPPYPSLYYSYEKALKGGYKSEIAIDAKIFIKSQFNHKRNEKKPLNYTPPTTKKELSQRIENDECYFKNITFKNEDFSGSIIVGINFSNSVFLNCNFSNSTMDYSNFRQCNMQDCDFKGSSLENISFEGSDLKKCNFKKSKLLNSNFKNADIRNVNKIEFDENYLLHTHFSPKSGDKWSVLQRNYTSIRLFINLLIFIVFITPVLLNFFGLVSISKFEKILVENNIVEFNEGFSSDLNTIEIKNKKIVFNNFEKKKVIEAMINESKLDLWNVILSMLFLYNILRSWLTFNLTPLKESYINNNYTPPYANIRSLYLVHRFLQLLLYITYIPLLYNLFKIIQLEIYLPK